jgi:hypothetical protein
MLYCFWLAVQFFRCKVTFWPITALNSVLPFHAYLNGSLDAAFKAAGGGFTGYIIYYVFGTVGYIFLGGIVIYAGSAAARIALVGWAKYLEEERALEEAAQA